MSLITRVSKQPIYCHQTEETYPSQGTAAQVLGVSQASISKHLAGKADRAGDYTFEKVDVYTPPRHLDYQGDEIFVGDRVIFARNGGSSIATVLELTYGSDSRPTLLVRWSNGTQKSLFNLGQVVLRCPDGFSEGTY